jgi:uncharacterized protein YyaL (SSP411 family)
MKRHLKTCTLRLLLALPLCLLCAGLIAGEEKKPRPKHTNALARESSPYLLQHAHNPVNWFPWGPEAFAKAKKEGKLVFLSIGYSSCHWCHVMEKESFSNEEVAKILNEHFVCIKVDREERPDVDQIYMTALTDALGQPGGWPLSMFLTPEGKPIVGGSYWPPEDKKVEGGTIIGFKTVLGRIQELYKEEKKALFEHADKVAEATQQSLDATARGRGLVDLDHKLVDGAVKALEEGCDPVHGGIGNPLRDFRGPKFPTPPSLLLLEHEAARSGSRDLKKAVALTLDHMARGGIYDHLGGGFHRYSTERTWTVPHFEKMLYDNAQLLEVYAAAHRRVRKPHYERVLRETVDFIAREMTSPEGAFYSALDADSEGEEGRFYVWTEKELAEALPDEKERTLFKEVYGADKGYNFESKYHILTLPQPLDEAAKARKMTREQLTAKLAPLHKKLFAVRAKRERPFLDTKVLTAWNGQMIAGLARAGEALGDKKPIAMAEKAADFLLKTMKDKDGRLLRTYGAAPGEKPKARLNGYLDDYVFLTHGLLTLHEVTKKKRWLEEAKSLTEAMVKHYQDDKAGGFFYTSHDHEKLFARAKDQFDGAQPSGNSLAARNLVRLWILTGEKRYGELAEKTIKALVPSLQGAPGGSSTLADALAMYLEKKKD